MQASNADVPLSEEEITRNGNHNSLCNQVTEADLRALGTALLLQACVLSLQ